MTKDKIITAINETKAIAIIRSAFPEKLLEASRAVLRGGFKVLEITSNTPRYLEVISEIKREIDGVIIGAGTITTEEQAREAISAGAMFLVTPVAAKEVIDYAFSKDVAVVMGAYSPTEIYNAMEWKADYIKLFPANHLGPNYLKAVIAPLGQARFVPTGGVRIDNVGDWHEAGAVAFGLGGSIVNDELLEKGDYQGITQRVENFRMALENL